jgi:hypothetical protein
MLKRAIRAITRKYNVPDPVRCDYAFEFRTYKYRSRGFCMLVPGVNSEAGIDKGSVPSNLFTTWTKMVENEKWQPEKTETSRYFFS